MSGIRIGTLYTENDDVVQALGKLGPFHSLPGIVQHQVAQLFQDRGVDSNATCALTNTMYWENSSHIRLVTFHSNTVSCLGTNAGQ